MNFHFKQPVLKLSILLLFGLITAGIMAFKSSSEDYSTIYILSNTNSTMRITANSLYLGKLEPNQCMKYRVEGVDEIHIAAAVEGWGIRAYSFDIKPGSEHHIINFYQ